MAPRSPNQSNLPKVESKERKINAQKYSQHVKDLNRKSSASQSPTSYTKSPKVRFDPETYKKQLQRKVMAEIRDEERQSQQLAAMDSNYPYRSPEVKSRSKHSSTILTDNRRPSKVVYNTPSQNKSKSMLPESIDRYQQDQIYGNDVYQLSYGSKAIGAINQRSKDLAHHLPSIYETPEQRDVMAAQRRQQYTSLDNSFARAQGAISLLNNPAIGSSRA